MSVDSRHSLRTWSNSLGGIRHPLISDFWPHGEVTRSLGVMNEDSGTGRRSLFIIDPSGVVRHTEVHQGTLPDPEVTAAKLAELQSQV